MNNIEIKLDIPKVGNKIEKFDDFNIKYYKYDIKFLYKDNISIQIKSNCKLETIFNFFLTLHKMIFFNYGFFMEVKKYIENDKEIDIKKYIDLDFIYSDKQFIHNFQITSLKKLFNKKTIKNFLTFNNKNFLGSMSLFYIKSDSYSKMLLDHRLAIMSQISEGLIENNLERKIKKISNTRHISFLDRIYYYFKTLSKISKENDSKIFKVLKTYPRKISKELTQLRHQVSHYIIKENVISTKKMLYCFYLLELTYRIVFLNEIGINYGKELKSNLDNIHDWILTTTEKNFSLGDLKTATYKMNYIFNHIQNK